MSKFSWASWLVCAAASLAGLVIGGGAALVIAFGLLFVGGMIYVSEADRRKPHGALGGTFRAFSGAAFMRSLPWDLGGAALVLYVAFGGS